MIKFGVSFIYSSYLSDIKESSNISMESICLIDALSYEAAKEVAVKFGLEKEHSYKNMNADNVSWILSGLRIYEIINPITENNVEVFSRFIDKSCESLLLADCDQVFIE